MKYVLALLTLVSLSSLAQESCTDMVSHSEAKDQLKIDTKTPKHLKGATIIIRQADGKETSVPAERFKVVPRKQQFIVTKVETTMAVHCFTNNPRKNRASLLGGYGAKNGLTTTTVGTTTTVESKSGVVGGAQYQRMLNKRLSVGLQGQTNETGSVLLGLDW